MMAEPFEVTDANFQKEVVQSQTPVLVDFWAEWCVPCKAIAPAVHAIAQEYASLLRVGKLNADDNSNTPARLGVLGLPTLILFKDGQEVERITGIFQRAGLPTEFRLSSSQQKRLLTAMQLDKKVSGGEVKFVLARRIGAVDFGQRVPMAAIEQVLNPQPSTLNP